MASFCLMISVHHPNIILHTSCLLPFKLSQLRNVMKSVIEHWKPAAVVNTDLGLCNEDQTVFYKCVLCHGVGLDTTKEGPVCLFDPILTQ